MKTTDQTASSAFTMQKVNTPFGDVREGQKFVYESWAFECVAIKIKAATNDSGGQPENCKITEVLKDRGIKHGGGKKAGDLFHCRDKVQVDTLHAVRNPEE